MKLIKILSLLFIFSLLLNATGIKREGIVLEHIPSGGYSYVKFKDAKEIIWIALPETKLEKNETITINEQVWMTNFESKTLDKVFEKILFATHDSNPYSKNDQQESVSFPSLAETLKQTAKSEIKKGKVVETTIAEIKKDKEKFKNKTIKVQGKVIKVLRGIMKSSWIHIQDLNTNDTLIFRALKEDLEKEQTVQAIGVVDTNVDYGYGYIYDTIVLESEFKKL